MTALEEEEKDMEVVELIVHTEEELEMKQEQLEKAKKRWVAKNQSSSFQQRCQQWNLKVEAIKNGPQRNLCHVFGRS